MPSKKNISKKPPAQAKSGQEQKVQDDLLKLARRADKGLSKHKHAGSWRLNNPLRFGVTQKQPEQELGQRLHDSRQLAGLTQDQLAERTKQADEQGRGISAAVISLYERGVNRPGPKEIRLLCEALRVSPSHLIYGTDDPFDNLADQDRFAGWASSEPEFMAQLTYCFSRLHHHHRHAIMELMIGLLRGWNQDFDSDLYSEADKSFLNIANELRLLIEARKKPPKK